MRTAASWVIRERVSGKAIFETFSEKLAAAINTVKYESVPIDKYLAEVNQQIARGKQ